jgi:hypothetical protein
LRNSPLVQNPEYRNDYQLNFDLDDNYTRYFWTSDINPENTFDVRYNRWNRLINLVQQLNYDFISSMPIAKWHDEIVNLKKIYDEKQPKKVYPIFTSK